MTVREQIAGIWFEWDERKSAKCWHERKFDFRAAAQVFFDERALTFSNLTWEGEERFQVVGEIPVIGIVTVVFAVREHYEEKSWRIISARKAIKSEEAGYRQGIQTPVLQSEGSR